MGMEVRKTHYIYFRYAQNVVNLTKVMSREAAAALMCKLG